jgi:hypothetical protein
MTANRKTAAPLLKRSEGSDRRRATSEGSSGGPLELPARVSILKERAARMQGFCLSI